MIHQVNKNSFLENPPLAFPINSSYIFEVRD